MQIDRNVLIGLLIAEVLKYHDADEIMKDKKLGYIASVIKKKHTSLKFGQPKHRMNIPKYHKELNAVADKWNAHVMIQATAWNNAKEKISTAHLITSTDMIVILIKKNPSVLKSYGFNQKKIDSFANSSNFKGKHYFASSRTISVIMECLEAEIAHYNYNEKVA